KIIAVDFGGTYIRAAFFPSLLPPPTSQNKTATLASEGPESVISRLIQAIESQIPKDSVDLRIGIGAPGPLDPRNGVILSSPNLAGWTNIPLRDRLSEHFGVPVFLGNDANVAALGEWRFGAGQGTENMIYLTISTGIGGGVIADGRLLLGARGLAGELGHLTIESNGPTCGCGIKGHIEAVAAGPAIARNATAQLDAGKLSALNETLNAQGSITSVDIGKAAQAGDELAISVIEDAGLHIGHHLANLAHAFNPEVFILGGGVSLLGDLLFEPIRRSLREHIMDPAYLDGLRVLPAALGDDAGLVGAMVLASQS
ncbi:MAG: ROK family protein, partial [Anaerolineales bacterium]|nr:ROK family protein [Anaerolineales bacterium]